MLFEHKEQMNWEKHKWRATIVYINQSMTVNMEKTHHSNTIRGQKPVYQFVLFKLVTSFVIAEATWTCKLENTTCERRLGYDFRWHEICRIQLCPWRINVFTEPVVYYKMWCERAGPHCKACGMASPDVVSLNFVFWAVELLINLMFLWSLMNMCLISKPASLIDWILVSWLCSYI